MEEIYFFFCVQLFNFILSPNEYWTANYDTEPGTIFIAGINENVELICTFQVTTSTPMVVQVISAVDHYFAKESDGSFTEIIGQLSQASGKGYIQLNSGTFVMDMNINPFLSNTQCGGLLVGDNSCSFCKVSGDITGDCKVTNFI